MKMLAVTRRGESSASRTAAVCRGFECHSTCPGPNDAVRHLTPTILLRDGKLAVGAPGGSRIITAVLETILNVIFGMNAQEAVDAPRFHHQWQPDRLSLEKGFSPDTDRAAEGPRARDRRIQRCGEFGGRDDRERSRLASGRRRWAPSGKGRRLLIGPKRTPCSAPSPHICSSIITSRLSGSTGLGTRESH